MDSTSLTRNLRGHRLLLTAVVILLISAACGDTADTTTTAAAPVATTAVASTTAPPATTVPPTTTTTTTVDPAVAARAACVEEAAALAEAAKAPITPVLPSVAIDVSTVAGKTVWYISGTFRDERSKQIAARVRSGGHGRRPRSASDRWRGRRAELEPADRARHRRRGGRDSHPGHRSKSRFSGGAGGR